MDGKESSCLKVDILWFPEDYDDGGGDSNDDYNE